MSLKIIKQPVFPVLAHEMKLPLVCGMDELDEQPKVPSSVQTVGGAREQKSKVSQLHLFYYDPGGGAVVIDLGSSSSSYKNW